MIGCGARYKSEHEALRSANVPVGGAANRWATGSVIDKDLTAALRGSRPVSLRIIAE
jgi:hypothetical protein